MDADFVRQALLADPSCAADLAGECWRGQQSSGAYLVQKFHDGDATACDKGKRGIHSVVSLSQ